MLLSLISGSSGNASVITCGSGLILTDCGMSGKKLEETLAAIDYSCADISAILMTHEHIDHTRGVGVISRRYNIPVYATEGTFEGAEIGNIPDSSIHIIRPEKDFEISDVGVHPFSISHDANDPVGYSFFISGKKLTLATDTGEITAEIEKNILGSDEIILESNHDIEMLMYGSYPYNLKKRILGSKGHLSNDTASEVCLKLLNSGTKKIMLGHLSDENNTPGIAYETSKNILEKAGAKIGRDIELCVAERYKITRFR